MMYLCNIYSCFPGHPFPGQPVTNESHFGNERDPGLIEPMGNVSTGMLNLYVKHF